MLPPSPILTLTLNPALDMATEVAEILPGHKLRCGDPLLDPGGGGLNVSRAIRALGGESLALVALGGLTGDRLAGLIRASGLTFLSILAPGKPGCRCRCMKARRGGNTASCCPARCGARPTVAMSSPCCGPRRGPAGSP